MNSLNSIPGKVFTTQDYHPFGMLMPSRSYSSTSSGGYRFGFNDKEKDDEVEGAGNWQDYGMRMYSPRLGRFPGIDPLAKKFPELTPYQFASNMPIQFIDLDGGEASPTNKNSTLSLLPPGKVPEFTTTTDQQIQQPSSSKPLTPVDNVAGRILQSNAMSSSTNFKSSSAENDEKAALDLISSAAVVTKEAKTLQFPSLSNTNVIHLAGGISAVADATKIAIDGWQAYKLKGDAKTGALVNLGADIVIWKVSQRIPEVGIVLTTGSILIPAIANDPVTKSMYLQHLEEEAPTDYKSWVHLQRTLKQH